MSLTSIPSQESPEKLIFVCPGCGLALSAELRLAGLGGPCPSCGVHVNAPGQAPVAAQPMVSSPANVLDPKMDQVRALKTFSGQRRGGIVADSALDHLHSDRRETAKSLWIFVLFILVIGACLMVTWFLKGWVSK